MVQAIENWADLTGRVKEVRPHPELPGYSVASVDVDSVRNVEKYPNLFEWAPKQTIEVNVPSDKAGEIKESLGKTVSLRVRKAGPTAVFAHPDFTPKP